MTWFISEWDNSKISSNKFSIVGVDEVRNDDYFSELNKNKSNSVFYSMFESVNPCKGYNDGSYFINSDGGIEWSSCKTSVIETPIETPEAGSVDNPYVFSITADNAFMLKLKDTFVFWGNKIDMLLEKLGYNVMVMGFNAGLGFQGAVKHTEEDTFDIVFYKKGTEPITLTMVLIIGIIATALVFISYNVRFSIKDYMNGKILIAREETSQAYYDGLKTVIESPFTTKEQKKDAADKLGLPPPLPPLEPPLDKDKDGGFLHKVKPLIYGILAIALVVAAMRFIPKKSG